MVECLPNMLEAVSSRPATWKEENDDSAHIRVNQLTKYVVGHNKNNNNDKKLL